MKASFQTAAAVALVAVTLAPAAFAQQASRAGQTPYPANGTHACTQLESAIGLRGDECGKYTLSELAKMKIAHDNT